MKQALVITVVILSVSLQAQARYAELRFNPGETNKYTFSIDLVSADVTNGIHFIFTVSSDLTNALPASIIIHSTKDGRPLIPSPNLMRNANFVRCEFVIPTDIIPEAELMWLREYEGEMKKLGGAFHRIGLKEWHEFHRTRASRVTGGDRVSPLKE